MTRSIAIIPARGGSKRLPRKNILKLNNKPLIAWSIESALTSQIFSTVAVSTEDLEISSIARSYGTVVLERPNSLGTDEATCAEVCRWHLKALQEEGHFYDRLYCLYATAPLRTNIDIIKIESIFNSKNDCEAVIAVTSFSHYPFQAFRSEENGEINPLWPELCRKKAQILPH